MSGQRRIAVVTGSRADYGLLRWTAREIVDHPDLTLQLIVTGSHLEAGFGDSWREIEADGFELAARVPLALAGDAPVAIGHALGRGVIGLTDALARLQPDLLVVLGDRYEILAAAQAAMVLRIPIAHLHGGERTEGAIDEAIRHAVTKMAQLHFVAADEYRRRVIQLGEAPERVFMVGATGLDALARLEPVGRAALARELGLELRAPLLLVTLHPETLSDATADQAGPLLAALAERTDATLVITGSNADAAGRSIGARLARFARDHAARARFVEHLGQRRYLSLLGEVDAVVGNSSSGLIEAPAAGAAVVNIGQRQRGRLRAPAVIDCANRADAITAALARALDPAHRAVAARRETPYGGPGAAHRIVAVLAHQPLEGLLMKPFRDLTAAG